MEFEGATLDQYDEVIEKMGFSPGGAGAPGGLFHWITATDGGIRVTGRQKATISYSDMLAALRHDLIRHEYWAQAPTTTSTPQITPAPTWPALTAA